MYFTTVKTQDLQFVVSGDNESGKANSGHVVTFNANLSVPQDKRDEVIDAVTSIKLNLYSV